MNRVIIRIKMIWYVLTEKQVVLVAESHKHGTHQYKCKWAFDTRSCADSEKMINEFKPKIVK